MTYKEILWTPEQIEFIRQHGEISPAAAKEAISRSKINFDDVEDINEHYESHKWGSNADRAYRKRAVNRAVQHVELKAAVIAYEKGAQKLKEGETTRTWIATVDRYNRAFDRANALLIPDEEQTAAVNEAMQTIREGETA